ncbi:CoA-binding protein [Undibacterium sp. Ji67W]|uniref:CoA-binding protein n=1 Tax=Undibacterium sp. Ji67W TaxID=3413042 RepID=UPI003BF2DBB8
MADLFRQTKTIAVVGLSPKTHRASYAVAAYMQAHGYRIIPINPREAGKTILSEGCYADLAEARQHHHIDIVDCFRSADDIPPIAEAAIQIGARCLWMQSGIVNIDAARSAHEAGLQVVMDRCLKIEHQRFLVHINTATESE